MADQVLIEPRTSVFTGGEVRVVRDGALTFLIHLEDRSIVCKHSASNVQLHVQAILPVGDIPRYALDAYMGCISLSRHIAHSSMRAHYQEPTQKTPFGNLDWDKGFMHMRYLQVSRVPSSHMLAFRMS
jgi:hypothetical protein